MGRGGLALAVALPAIGMAAENTPPAVGLAVRDITPELPIRLAGYGARNQSAQKVDHPLQAQALALKNPSGERFVLVALDNLEVSRAFMQPVLQKLAAQLHLGRGEVAVVSSHTHSAPVLDQTSRIWCSPNRRNASASKATAGFCKPGCSSWWRRP